MRTEGQKRDPAPDTIPAVLAAVASTVSSARWTRRFTQGPGSVTLQADRVELVDAAITALYAYQRTRTWTSRWTIRVHSDITVDLAAADAAFAAGDTHDIGPSQLAQSLSVAGGRVYWDRDRATLIHLDRPGATITIYCTGLDVAAPWAIRLTRQAMTAQLIDHDAVYAHAAAFSHRGRGVAIAGHKGSGKTTTLLAALRVPDTDFVTNDRLLLHHDGTSLAGYAWPAHLRVGVGTLRALPDALAALPAQLQRFAAAPTTSLAAKVALDTADLPRLLAGGEVTDMVWPRLMLWPYRATENAPPQRVPPEQVREVAVRTRFFMRDPDRGASAHINHWLVPAADPARSQRAVQDLAGHVAATIPCFRLPVTDTPAALAHTIKQLLATIPDTNTAPGERP